MLQKSSNYPDHFSDALHWSTYRSSHITSCAKFGQGSGREKNRTIDLKHISLHTGTRIDFSLTITKALDRQNY